MEAVNLANISFGARILDASSEVKGCDAKNVLLESENIWLSEEGLPQWICISLDQIDNSFDIVIRTIGWSCWRSFTTNPRKITVHVSRDGSKFKLWDTFIAQNQLNGTQLFCCAPISISLYPYIAFEIQQTFGGNQVYLNNIFLYSEEVAQSPSTPAAKFHFRNEETIESSKSFNISKNITNDDYVLTNSDDTDNLVNKLEEALGINPDLSSEVEKDDDFQIEEADIKNIKAQEMLIVNNNIELIEDGDILTNQSPFDSLENSYDRNIIYPKKSHEPLNAREKDEPKFSSVDKKYSKRSPKDKRNIQSVFVDNDSKNNNLERMDTNQDPEGTYDCFQASEPYQSDRAIDKKIESLEQKITLILDKIQNQNIEKEPDKLIDPPHANNLTYENRLKSPDESSSKKESQIDGMNHDQAIHPLNKTDFKEGVKQTLPDSDRESSISNKSVPTDLSSMIKNLENIIFDVKNDIRALKQDSSNDFIRDDENYIDKVLVRKENFHDAHQDHQGNAFRISEQRNPSSSTPSCDYEEVGMIQDDKLLSSLLKEKYQLKVDNLPISEFSKAYELDSKNLEENLRQAHPSIPMSYDVQDLVQQLQNKIYTKLLKEAILKIVQKKKLQSDLKNEND